MSKSKDENARSLSGQGNALNQVLIRSQVIFIKTLPHAHPYNEVIGPNRLQGYE